MEAIYIEHIEKSFNNAENNISKINDEILAMRLSSVLIIGQNGEDQKMNF